VFEAKEKLVFTLLLILCLAVVAYGGIVYWAYLRQRDFQYAPTHKDVEGRGNKTFSPWKQGNGQFLGYLRRVERPRKVVVFFHGNGGEALDRGWVDELVPTRDLLVLAEYPGYGAIPGKPSQPAILQHAENLVDQLRLEFGTVPITVIGESLGSAVAGYLASKGKADRVAFISPFSSMSDLARRHFPLLPAKYLLKDKFDLVDFAKNANAPVRIVHGTLDDLVPIELGREVYQAYHAADKQFTEIPGFGHNNIDAAVLHSPFANRFRQFLEN
jgi:uncharacterized protein